MDEELLGALAEARALGFLGPGPIKDHMAHAEAFLDLWPSAEEGCAIDVGSGGGVPGLVLACRLPQWRWVLLDVNRRRTSFLARAAAAIPGLRGRVDVVRAPTDDAAVEPTHRMAYDVATARGFGPPERTAQHAGAFVRVGGVLLVSDPPGVPDRWPDTLLRPLGLAVDSRRERAPGIVSLRRTDVLGAGFPRH